MSQPASLILPGAVLLLVLLELRAPQFRASWTANPARLRRNILFLTASLVVMASLPFGNALVSRHTVRLLDWGGLWPVEVVCCFLAAELLGWLLHYVKHRSRFLWAFHFQHHREEQYNVWLATHTHALEVAVSAVFIAVTTSALGFSRLAVETYLVFYSFTKVYQHSAFRYSLGVLDYLIISPGYHRLHHRKGSQCNYGISLTVFDVVFRTSRWPAPVEDVEEEPCGVSDEAGYPYGFWQEMTFFLRRTREESMKHRSIGTTLASLSSSQTSTSSLER